MRDTSFVSRVSYQRPLIRGGLFQFSLRGMEDSLSYLVRVRLRAEFYFRRTYQVTIINSHVDRRMREKL